MPEPVRDDAGPLGGGGDDRRSGVEAGPQAPGEGPHTTAAPTGRLGREPPGLAGTRAGLARVPASHVPARDLVAGGTQGGEAVRGRRGRRGRPPSREGMAASRAGQDGA